MSSSQKRAKLLLVGKGVARENSDDELGTDEELTWEWIDSGSGCNITGARFGNFVCRLGDCVLLKAEIAKEAWVGIICEFKMGETDEKLANFMWFSTEREIRNKNRKRRDAMENELYITPSFDWNPLTTINGSAKVMSRSAFLGRFPSGRLPAKSNHRGKVFICRRGCNTRTATYTPEFNWEELYRGAPDIHILINKIKAQTKTARQRIHQTQHNERTGKMTLQTPTAKKRRLNGDHDVNKNPNEQEYDVPDTSPERRINRRKFLEFTPLGSRQRGAAAARQSPYQAIRSRLHVSCVPSALPCRETAFEQVFSHLEAAIMEGTGSCIYISGTPGTGKTATVREVIAQMNAAVEIDEIDDFIFVEVNGMKITDPHQSYTLLWEALHGNRVSPSHALALLNAEFSKPNPRRVPCVVLMDELDQLATKNQSIMYNFFNWPSMPHSRLIVLAVANTMDLPERTLSNKISSRLGLTRITFPGYTYDQLMQIIESRLQGMTEAVFDEDAIQFASRKVAAVSGDARRALEICRRAVEITEEESLDATGLTCNPGSTPPGKDSPSDGQPKHCPRVSINTIKVAIKEATSSHLQQLIKNLPWTTRVLLFALVQRTLRNGTSESNLAEVMAEAKRQIQLTDVSGKAKKSSLRDGHMTQGQAASFQYVGASSASGFQSGITRLIEAGIIEIEARRRDRVSRVRLAIRADDAALALRNDGELRGRGILA